MLASIQLSQPRPRRSPPRRSQRPPAVDIVALALNIA